MKRRLLTAEEINEIAQRHDPSEDDIFDLIFTARSLQKEIDDLCGDDPIQERLIRTVMYGLDHAIRDHGPITREWRFSAAKRIYSRIRGTRYDPEKNGRKRQPSMSCL